MVDGRLDSRSSSSCKCAHNIVQVVLFFFLNRLLRSSGRFRLNFSHRLALSCRLRSFVLNWRLVSLLLNYRLRSCLSNRLRNRLWSRLWINLLLYYWRLFYSWRSFYFRSCRFWLLHRLNCWLRLVYWFFYRFGLLSRLYYGFWLLSFYFLFYLHRFRLLSWSLIYRSRFWLLLLFLDWLRFFNFFLNTDSWLHDHLFLLSRLSLHLDWFLLFRLNVQFLFLLLLESLRNFGRLLVELVEGFTLLNFLGNEFGRGGRQIVGSWRYRNQRFLHLWAFFHHVLGSGRLFVVRTARVVVRGGVVRARTSGAFFVVLKV